MTQTEYDKLILCTPGIYAYWPLGQTQLPIELVGRREGTRSTTPKATDLSQVMVNNLPGHAITTYSANGGGIIAAGTCPTFGSNVPNGFTIETWFATTSAVSCSMFDTASASPRIALFFNDGNSFQGVYLGTSGTYYSLSTSAKNGLTNGQLRHVVFAAVPNTGEMKIYLDGKLIGSQVVSTAGVGTWGALHADTGFGRTYSIGSYVFIGMLARCAMYTRAINAGEVDEHYRIGLGDVNLTGADSTMVVMN